MYKMMPLIDRGLAIRIGSRQNKRILIPMIKTGYLDLRPILSAMLSVIVVVRSFYFAHDDGSHSRKGWTLWHQKLNHMFQKGKK